MFPFLKAFILQTSLCMALTSVCLAQVDVSISAGGALNYASLEQSLFRGPIGKLIVGENKEINEAINLQVAIPIRNNWQLEAGVRVIFKAYKYELEFDYPGQFTLSTYWVSAGTALELPLHLVYQIPDPIFGRDFKLNGGLSISRSAFNIFNTGFDTHYYNPPPNTSSFTFDSEPILRKAFLIPALEAGLQFSPVFFNNLGVRALYHLDLIPTFGGVTYKNHFAFSSYGPPVEGFPEGTIKAKRTSYISVLLSYRLPIGDKKRKAAEAAQKTNADFEDDGSE